MPGSMQWLRRNAKQILFGAGNQAQAIAVAVRDPQTEVTFSLLGLGAPRDVTRCQMMACGAPLLIGIGLEEGVANLASQKSKSTLEIRHSSGKQLVTIRLYYRFDIPVEAGAKRLCLFTPLHTRNRCLPFLQLWRRYLFYAYQRWRSPYPEFSLSAREVHAMIGFCSCPRPVALVSVREGDKGANIFPMNLMGTIAEGCFAFALKTSTPVVSLVGRAGKIALSTIPAEQSPVAYTLAENHRKEEADWEQVPFASRPSPRLGFPVPEFAIRVREMELVSQHSVGSHTLFISRIVGDERWRDLPEFCTVHGVYQSYRLRHEQGGKGIC